MASEATASLCDSNLVRLSGKVSRNRGLKYTPHGTPLLEFTLAASQRFLDKQSKGYFDVVLVGRGAEEWASRIKIGQPVALTGSLWMREYRSRNGTKLIQVSIVMDSSLEQNKISIFGGENEENR